MIKTLQRPGTVGLVALMLIGLVGCSSSNPAIPSGESPPPGGVRSAAVARGSITPVLTLDAEVTSSISYEITAPVDGKLVQGTDGATVIDQAGVAHELARRGLDTGYTYLVPDGATVSRGLPIAKSVYAGFVVASQVQGADLLRMQESPQSAKAQIAGGAEPFTCDLLDSVPSSFGEQPSTRRLYCIVPPTQPAIGGLTGVLAVRFPSVQDALVLPLEAVGGSVSRGSVLLQQRDGASVEQSVKLGPSDGTQIVIADGLKEGDVVLMPSPSLLHD